MNEVTRQAGPIVVTMGWERELTPFDYRATTVMAWSILGVLLSLLLLLGMTIWSAIT